MKRIPFLALVLFVIAAGCGYGGGSTDGGNDGKTLDAADGNGGDASFECTPGQSRCPAGLECLCCGSIGPAPICLCSIACNSGQECTYPGQPECNQPTPDSAGICTPTGYNCCWFCQ
jgi:hypothetical protein